MQILTSELTGAALDWAVCRAQHPYAAMSATHVWLDSFDGECDFLIDKTSTDWAEGGLIMVRERIAVTPNTSTVGDAQGECQWCANNKKNQMDFQCGPTALIAAMRCYVASKLGDEVDVPKELL